MKLIYTLILGIIFLSTSLAQPFNTGTLTITFNDPARTGGFGSGGGPGRQIQTEIYYPATSAGSNVAVANGNFPIVVFGHGFLMDWSSYDNIYSLLSKRGYIVALPRTEGSASPNHADFGTDLALVAQKLLALNTTNTLAPIFVGKILQKAAIGGHSMGGGASFLAAKNNTNIACLFNFAAAETNPKSSSAAKFVNVPTLIIGGERDCVAPPSTNQDKMYDSCVATKKFEIILKKLTHCDFGNGANTNCLLGQNLSFCSSQVSNTLALAHYMTYVNPFLDNLLKSNCAAGNVFMDSLTLSPIIFTKKQTGSLACTLGLNELRLQGNTLYPNPLLGDVLVVKAPQVIKTITIYDWLGQTHKTVEVNALVTELNLSSLPKGLYVVQLSGTFGNATQRLIRD